jgi:hypothetical protein
MRLWYLLMLALEGEMLVLLQWKYRQVIFVTIFMRRFFKMFRPVTSALRSCNGEVVITHSATAPLLKMNSTNGRRA